MKHREELSLEDWVEAYISTQAEKITRKGSEYVGPCPNCGGDDRFSMSSRKGSTGTLVNCRKCQDFKTIVACLFGSSKDGKTDRQADYNPAPKPKPKPDEYGCTIAQFLDYIAVPIDPAEYFITQGECHVSKDAGEVPAVRIPNLDADFEEIGAVYRVVVRGSDKVRYEKGSSPAVYGLQWLERAKQIGHVVVCEGQTDAITLHHHGIPAFGIPGVGNLKVLQSSYFEGIDQVYVIEEHDEAGEKFPHSVAVVLKDLGVSAVTLRVRLEAKDVNDLYKENPKRFIDRFGRSVKEARGLRKSNIRVMFARDILRKDYPPMRWAIPGLLPEGLAVLFSSPKVGKSFCALQAAVAVASGSMFSGRLCWKAEEREVILIDLEQCEGVQMQGRFRHLGVDHESWNTIVIDDFPKLDKGGLEELDILLEEHPRCGLVVIDVWSNVKPAQRFDGENAYDAEYRWCKELRHLFLKRRACCLVIHHDRKGDSSGMTEKASGTKALTGAANAVLHLERGMRETKGTLSMIGRDGIQESVLTGEFIDRKWTFDPPAEEQSEFDRHLGKQRKKDGTGW